MKNLFFYSKVLITCVVSLLISLNVSAQERKVNYDENKIKPYVLPDILTLENGQKVNSKRVWEKKRRKEIMSIFTNEMYGTIPTEKLDIRYENASEERPIFNGKGTLSQIDMIISGNGKTKRVEMLLILPAKNKSKSPVFVGLNFKGNHTLLEDEDIRISSSVMTMYEETSIPERGCRYERWQVEMLLDNNMGLLTACYNDFFIDKPEYKDESVLSLFKNYQSEKDKDNSGQAISAWSWGLMRMADFLKTRNDRVDMGRLAIIGHSRLGKTSLWAGVNDKRFKVIISNDSGCGGAALSKRAIGENVKIITDAFPHWFCRAYNKYAENESEMPFDQHELIALAAPRAIYIASAEDDKWADPKGEFLSAVYAGKAYQLYNIEGLDIMEQPKINEPIMRQIGYHIRTGKHDVTKFDWQCYIKFAQMHFDK